ncbi:hypothetical protein GCK32_016064, partial [Trichostrongylus colubriformis]
INVDEPSGSRNQELRADISLVLHEPWFVPKPDSRKEDDGVLLIRALDVVENKAMLLVIDAETMKEIGRAFVPISIPFGFHNRFYTKQDLGLPEGFSVNNVVNHFRPSETKGLGYVTLPLRKFSSTHPTTKGATFAPLTSTTGRHGNGKIESSKTTPREVPVTVTTQAWSSSSTQTRTTTTAATTSLTTAKIPRWWPLATTTEPLWWQSVKVLQNKASTKAPASEGKSLSSKSVIFPDNGVNNTAEAIYAETLGALCSWLPKVFSAITSDICLRQGKKAVQ